LSVAGGFAAAVGDAAGWLDVTQQQQILSELAGRPDTTHLLRGNSQLQLLRVESTEPQTIAVFQQTMEGLPVHGSYISVTRNVDGLIGRVSHHTLRHLATGDSLIPQVTLSEALQTAHQDFVRQVTDSHGQLVWFRSGERAELAWEVATVVPGGNIHGTDLEFVTVIDANTGGILSQVQSPSLIDEIVQDAAAGLYPRIVINDAIGAAGSRAYAEPFDAVVEISVGCTGTLMADDVVIAARHCGAGPGTTINFGDNSNAPDYSATVQSSQLPGGNGSLLDAGDVAILTLTAPVPSGVATPMRFIDATGDLVGMTAALLGYGYNGLGSTGHGFSSDGWRWGGENVIDVYGTPASASGANIISTDFDDGSQNNNNIPSGSPLPVTYEATTAAGDSGGPVLVQAGSEWVIAGVLSGGTTSTSRYGDISWWTGTALFRTQIEAAGGVFVGTEAGSVSFDRDSYLIGDTVDITVNDGNAVNPIIVSLVSDSGDSETLTLGDIGGGIFSGSMVTSAAGVTPGDGVLQVSDADLLTVTYIDADDGTGNSNTVNDTATIFEPGNGVLIGVDFDEPNAAAPSNWTTVSGGGNATFGNLSGEDGSPTVIDLAIDELTDGEWFDFPVTPNAATIPLHLNSLINVDGQIYTGADPLRLTYLDLTPLADYEIYVLAAEGFYSSIQQQVTITGEGVPVTFSQNFDSEQLFVNDQLGDNTRQLSEYAQVITANAAGQIVIDITPLGNTDDVVLAGVAIQEVPVVDLIDPFATKFLDGSPVSGTLQDARFSDDFYFQLIPTPTTNPVKQKIDVILLTEYNGPLNRFEFHLEAAMSGGPQGDVIQKVEMWDRNAGVWELFDSRPASVADTTVVASASGDLSRFVHPLTGEIIARVGWSSPQFSGSSFNWTVNVDQFGWLIS
jgi:V8-like Glu-specific endopeptidase